MLGKQMAAQHVWRETRCHYERKPVAAETSLGVQGLVQMYTSLPGSDVNSKSHASIINRDVEVAFGCQSDNRSQSSGSFNVLEIIRGAKGHGGEYVFVGEGGQSANAARWGLVAHGQRPPRPFRRVGELLCVLQIVLGPVEGEDLSLGFNPNRWCVGCPGYQAFVEQISCCGSIGLAHVEREGVGTVNVIQGLGLGVVIGLFVRMRPKVGSLPASRGTVRGPTMVDNMVAHAVGAVDLDSAWSGVILQAPDGTPLALVAIWSPIGEMLTRVRGGLVGSATGWMLTCIAHQNDNVQLPNVLVLGASVAVGYCGRLALAHRCA